MLAVFIKVAIPLILLSMLACLSHSLNLKDSAILFSEKNLFLIFFSYTIKNLDLKTH